MNRDKKIIYFLCLLVWLLLITLGMTSKIMTILCVIILMALIMVSKPDCVVEILLFFYPFYCLFKIGGIGISYYNLLILSSILSLFYDKNKGKLCIKKNYYNACILLIMFTGYLFISELVLFGSRDCLSVILDMTVPMLCVIMVANRQKEINVYKIIIIYAFAIILAGILGSGLININNIDAYVTMKGYRIAGIRLNRLQGLTVNPNYYSLDINLCIAGLLAFPYVERRKFKWFEISLICFLIMLGIMTLSKSFIVGLIFEMGVFYLINIKNNKKSFKFPFFLLIIGFIMLVFLRTNEYILAILERFILTDDSLSAMTSSRWDIWGLYLNYFINNIGTLLIGEGINAQYISTIGGNTYAPHSIYIESIFYFGIIGSVLFLIMLVKIIFNSFGKRNGGNLLLLLTFLVRGLAINLINREAFLTDLILILLIFNCSVKDSYRNYMEEYNGNSRYKKSFR